MFLHSQLPVYEFLFSICQEFDNILGRSKCASDSILRRNRPDRRNRIGSARRARGRLVPCSRSSPSGEAAVAQPEAMYSKSLILKLVCSD